MSPTVTDILRESEKRLAAVDSPRLSAELLLAHVLDCSRIAFVTDRARMLTDTELSRFRELIERRAAGEPVAYLLGSREFYGLDFTVTPDVLIPRPETEHIVDEVEAAFRKDASFRFVDLGTGSGILAVTIAHLFPRASGIAVDISSGALAVARSNAAKHQVVDRLDFRLGDFTTHLFDDAQFDLVVSNPPYVTEQEYSEASLEVTVFEPVGALVSGSDGLDHVRAMLSQVSRVLKPGGLFLMEIGWGQGAAVKKIMLDLHPEFRDVTVLPDLAGRDRVVRARHL